MNSEPLWKSADDIINQLRSEIEQNGENIRQRQSDLGWQYAGRVFESGIRNLRNDLAETKGYRAVECTAFHFLKPAKICNPTKRYIILLIQGHTSLSPGGPLTKSYLYHFDDEPILEVRKDGVDVICMALEKKEDSPTS